jgi:hypothetical protein
MHLSLSEGHVMSKQLEAALDWASRGFRVFPLRVGGKRPLEDDYIRARWAERPYNVGVLTDNLIVVDADEKNGKQGMQTFFDLDLPIDTLTVRTPSGGRHFYYKGPNRNNSSEKLGSGIDIRSYHGYVIAPGSYLDPLDPNNKGIGGEYTLELDAPIEAAPPHLIAKLDEPTERQAQAPKVDLDSPSALLRGIQYLDNEAPIAVEGNSGDTTTLKVAFVLKDMGLSEGTVWQLMVERWNDRCLPSWDHSALADKVRNAFSYGKLAPGASAPGAEFGGVTVPPVAVAAVQARRWLRHGDPWNTQQPWLYHDVLPRGGVGFVTGPSQGGKSFLAINLAHSLATGEPFFGTTPDERGGTIILAAEAAGTLRRRLAALGEDDALPISVTGVGALGTRGVMESLEGDLRVEMDRMLTAYGIPVRLIVLDTLNASGLVDDENDNTKAAWGMKALETLGAKLGVLVLATHHPAKAGRGVRGAGAWFNSADVVLEIVRDGKSTVRELDMTKNKEADQRSLGAFTLIPVRLGVDEKQRDVISCVVHLANMPAREYKNSPEFVTAFMDALDAAIVDDGTEVEGIRYAELEAVLEQFKERKGGSRDRSAIRRAFKQIFDQSVEMGAVRAINWTDGRRYLCRAF